MWAEPVVTHRREDGWDIPLLVWRLASPALAISSGPLGGGIGVRRWVVNATVPMTYRRDDPDAHLTALADQLDLRGPGVGLLTGVDVTERVSTVDQDVRVWATVGLGTPIWAAEIPEAGEPFDVDDAVVPEAEPARPVGTVNIVALLPVRLSEAALVNAVATVTEAKVQALRELGLPGTGTPTDSVTLLCPPDGPVAPYGGPRSRWGASLARAACRAVRTGGATPCVPWSDQPARRGVAPD